MGWIIDRFEDGLAVIENTEDFEIIICPVKDLPAGVTEGTALIKALIKDKTAFSLDTSEEAAARSRRISEKFDRLKKKT